METEKYLAIVCKSIDYKENDKLVSLYTLTRGKLFASLKGVKKAGAKLRYAAEPFCFGEFSVAGRGTGDDATHVITGCTAQEMFFDITKDINKYYTGCAALEILDTAGLFDEGNKELFLAVLETLKNLAFSEINNLLLLVRFMSDTLVISGYNAYPDGLQPATESALRLISGQPRDTLGNLRVSENVLADALRRLDEYFSAQFGRKLKSVKTLLTC